MKSVSLVESSHVHKIQTLKALLDNSSHIGDIFHRYSLVYYKYFSKSNNTSNLICKFIALGIQQHNQAMVFLDKTSSHFKTYKLVTYGKLYMKVIQTRWENKGKHPCIHKVLIVEVQYLQALFLAQFGTNSGITPIESCWRNDQMTTWHTFFYCVGVSEEK